MKLIIFAALLAFTAARPQLEEEPIPVAIIREESDPIEGANFRNEFELDNGQSQYVVGSADENGAQVMSGSYSFVLDDGTIATFNWVADAKGFRVESPLLPIDNPIAAHAKEQVEFADAQQAAGLVWDQAVEAWV
ncbi:unnamed protein product [Meganyctiphanes norvegica]|uniref:Uncharacterized protein n=1 Tax=Meganyctiphanes norvegica TaxID=48144 RepID=A0AAV2SGS5_MEGNR